MQGSAVSGTLCCPPHPLAIPRCFHYHLAAELELEVASAKEKAVSEPEGRPAWAVPASSSAVLNAEVGGQLGCLCAAHHCIKQQNAGWLAAWLASTIQRSGS